MIKFVYCVRRRPELSVEEFRKYWLEKHGPLVRSYAKALRATRYLQSHTIDTPLNLIARQTRGTTEPYDRGLVEQRRGFDGLHPITRRPESQSNVVRR
jgi:EthD domain